ncbi:Flp family type IVb pilin [Lichenibacterium minor]|uniref:Flp family type IVb pilin n=1 Tax=Lichenibacterium minor TaxID=2316528 RepID=A0A4Q2UFM3_9HYPH|nr:Flp family type IVb pilin [Lichenibacterium minor]RYC34027.1 Flp family type IVb pilin [Lichenibacterium minor]
MGPLFRRFLADRSGGSAIEHGLIVAMIACALIGTLQNMGVQLKANFGKIAAALK